MGGWVGLAVRPSLVYPALPCSCPAKPKLPKFGMSMRRALEGATAGAAEQAGSSRSRRQKARRHAAAAGRLQAAHTAQARPEASSPPVLPAGHGDGARPDGRVWRHGRRHDELLHDAPRVDQPPLLHGAHLVGAVDQLLGCGRGWGGAKR